MHITQTLRTTLVAIVAVGVCAATAAAVRLPSTGPEDRAALAGRFGFTALDLSADRVGARTVRNVQPALEHIRSWISSVGAGVALSDLDGDGLPNERCLVDPRDDSVTIAATGERPDRMAPFALVATGVRYDAATTAPMGCVTADLNEDGLTDVLVHFWGRPPLGYLRIPDAPLAAAGFVAVDVAPDPTEVWNSTTANVLDLDGDGRLDLVVGNYFPDGARVLDPAAGRADPIAMQDSMSTATNGGRNRILRLESVATVDGVARPTYRDASAALTDRQARSWTLATGAQDLDDDGLPELYIANDFGPDALLWNRSRPGDVRFTELTGRRDATMPKSKVLGRDSFKSMGVTYTHVNQDGRPDILVSNITTPFALQESNFAFVSTGTGPLADRVAPYRDDSQGLGVARTGWAWDIKAADFDGDGSDEIVQALGFLRGETNRWAELQELAMGNDELLRHPASWPNFRPGDDVAGHQRNPFFVRDRQGRYVDIAADLGLDNPAVSRGLAVGDVDHDGKADLAVANQWGRSVFLHNTGPDRAFLGLQLLLPAVAPGGKPRPAIGADVTVTARNGRPLRAQLYPANGHTGVNAPELLFGLGDRATDEPLTVAVSWRDSAGRHSTTFAVAPGWHTVVLNPTRQTNG